MNGVDVERLLGSVINGTLGGRRKRSRGARRYLTGGKRSFLGASTLMTLAGVAWGVWETVNQPGAGSGQPTPPPPPPGPSGGSPPPPLPTAAPAVSPTPVVPPPIPGTGAPPGPPPLPRASEVMGGGTPVPPEVLRVLRLTLSAARADGTLTSQERDAIVAQARAVGAESMVTSELQVERPIAEIVDGVEDVQVRRDLYTLAYSIVRADETVTSAERGYLTELAGHLGIEAGEIDRLEQQAAARIEAAAEGAED